jgi:hypothetical protein
MGSGAVILYVPNFIKIGSGIQKLIGGIHRQQGDFISVIYFFKIRKVGIDSVSVFMNGDSNVLASLE